MSGSATEQAKWLKVTLGFDVDALANAGKPPATARGFLDVFKRKKKAKAEPEPTVEPKVPDTTDKELTEKLKSLMDKINALAAKKLDVKQLKSDLVDLTRRSEKAEQVTGDKRQPGIDLVKTRIDEVIAHVDALAKSLKDIMGDKKTDPTAGERSQIYEKALKDYYNLDIEVPAGMTNTHFDKMFDMFGTVPKSHTKQDKLKKLLYNTDNIGGVYYSGDCKIEMGNFGDATGMEGPATGYTLDGKQVPANSFNVTTLHEIGHSVDELHSIMGTHGDKQGCGKWQRESLDSVTTAMAKALKDGAGLSDKVTDELIKTAVQTALDAGTVTQPPTIEDADWQKMLPFLSSHCLPIRDDAQPYFTSAAPAIGDRIYTEMTKGWWYSYGASERQSTFVNNYQWRSPPEWFAEVYAITWLAKKPPPGAVAKEIAEYCWN